MSTDPRPRAVEPDDFDFYSCKPPILESLTSEDHRQLSPGEKMRRIFVAWNQVRDIHRDWYLERHPDATAFEILCDWSRHTGAAEVLANAYKDEAGRSSDQPLIVERRS
jgi:hypothetical protein